MKLRAEGPLELLILVNHFYFAQQVELKVGTSLYEFSFLKPFGGLTRPSKQHDIQKGAFQRPPSFQRGKAVGVPCSAGEG